MTIESRIHIEHAKGLFDPVVLHSVYAHFVKSEGRYRKLKEISEREKNAMERGESPDSMRLQETWYDIWIKAPSILHLIQSLTPYTLVTYPVQVRHVRKESHAVPWHQDIGYMKLLGERGHKQVITCFIPLEPEPSKCTTIEFALDNGAAPDTVYEHIPLDGFGAGLPPERFTKRKYFDLTLGDALIFGDLTLHRTYTPSGCDIERRSLEFRLIRREDMLPNKDYFDLERQAFIKTDDQRRIASHG